MTTPADDAGLAAKAQEAVETFRAELLRFFETNPLPDEHRELDQDRLLNEVVTRIQQQPAPAAQAHQPAPHAAATSDPAKPPQTKAPKAQVDHGKERATARARHPDLESLAEYWNRQIPEDTSGVAGLDKDFGPKVTAFKAAMEAAGISVHVVGAKRSKARAYLMRCAYLIYKSHGKYADVKGELDKKPDGVHIDWEEIRKTAVDEQGFKDFAALLSGKLKIGLDFSQAPSLNSNHIHGLAVDMVVEGWDGKIVEAVDPHGVKTSVPVKTFKDLQKVGDSYGVHHFPKNGEPNHWSINAH
jgi:hypothetical protein